MRISLYTDVYRLAVNKSPAVYTLSPVLDRLWRENRGSVNRLYENKNNHVHVKGFALSLACSRLRDSLVRVDWDSGRRRVFPTIWEPGTGYTHHRFETEDSGHSEMAKFLKGNKSTQKGQKEDSLHIIEGSIKNCTSRDVKKHRFTPEPRLLWGQASWLSDEHNQESILSCKKWRTVFLKSSAFILCNYKKKKNITLLNARIFVLRRILARAGRC